MTFTMSEETRILNLDREWNEAYPRLDSGTDPVKAIDALQKNLTRNLWHSECQG